MSKKGNRGTKEEVQNRILIGFQKAIRQSGSRDENRPMSLADQIKQMEREQEEARLAELKAKREKNNDKDSGTYFVPGMR